MLELKEICNLWRYHHPLAIVLLCFPGELRRDDGKVQAATHLHQECSDAELQWEIHQLYPWLYLHIKECKLIQFIAFVGIGLSIFNCKFTRYSFDSCAIPFSLFLEWRVVSHCCPAPTRARNGVSKQVNIWHRALWGHRVWEKSMLSSLRRGWKHRSSALVENDDGKESCFIFKSFFFFFYPHAFPSSFVSFHPSFCHSSR